MRALTLENARWARTAKPANPGNARSGLLVPSGPFRAQCAGNVVQNRDLDVACCVALPHGDEELRTGRPMRATTDRKKGQTRRKPSASSPSSLQAQLTNAAMFGDVDACMHLLRCDQSLVLHGGALKQLVRTCFQRGLEGRALELVMALSGDRKRQFSVLMKECIDRGDVEQLDRILASRAEVGYAPDLYTHTARISALGKRRQSPVILLQLHEAMRDPICACKIELYNAAISACVRSQDYAGAMYVWGLVLGDGGVKSFAKPDVVTFNAMIKVAGAMGMFEEAKRYFEMITEQGLVPTSWSYAALFSASAACQAGEAQFLIGVFDSMVVQPNDFILSSFFTAMSFPQCSKAEIDVVFRLLERSRGQDYELNDVTYTAFMTFLARQDMPDRAIDIWVAARNDEVDLSAHFYSALFSACAKGGGDQRRSSTASASNTRLSSSSEALANMAFDAFDEISGWWIAQDPDRVPKHVCSDVRMAYNAFLHFLGVVGQHDVAQLIFESMKAQGPEPDVVSYNTMLNLLGSSKDVDAALHMYWEMVQRGLKPTERTFGSLLHAFASVGDAAAARKIFDSLAAAGIAPNSVLYTSFIHASVRHGDDESLALAFDLADEMRRSHVPLTDVTYGCLLVACEKQGDVSRAFSLYQQSLEERVTPSDQMHNILISVCTRCGKLDDALDLVKSMARKHSNIQQHAMNSLTRALSIESPGRATRMLSLMTAMGMHPSRKTRLEVMKQCALAGDVTEALALFNNTGLVFSSPPSNSGDAPRGNQLEIDGPSGSALIISLCAAQNLDDAVRVYDTMMAAAWRKMDRLKEEKKTSLPKRALEPSGSALASLAQAHAAAGLTSQAWKFYLQLRHKSQSLEEATLDNRRMFEALIEGQCRAKNLKKALMVFDDWKAACSNLSVTRHQPLLKQLNVVVDEKSRGTPTNTPTTKAKGPRLSYLALAFLEAVRTAAARWWLPLRFRLHPHLSLYLPRCPPLTHHSKSSTQHPPPTTHPPAPTRHAQEVRRHPEHEWRVFDILATMRAQKESKRQSELARPPKRSHHFVD